MTTATGPVPVIHPGNLLSRNRRLLYVLVLGALVGLGPFTIDLYLPAFPVLAKDFGVGDAAIQLTLTGTTIGFALGQLIVGPWSDRVGRRIPLFVATGLHVVASVMAAMAPDVYLLMVFRVLQGVGAAGGGVVAMAIVRDLFGGRPLVKMLARLALVTSLAPVVAPLVGSQLLRVMEWRGIFIILSIYGAVMLVAAILSVRETRPRDREIPAGHSTMRERYRALFTDRVFIGVAVLGGMQFSGLFAYLSSSSFLFQEVYGLDAQQFGLLFGINSIGILVGNQTSARIMKWIGPQWILACTTTVQAAAAAAIVVGGLVGWGFLGVTIPLFFFILACGFAFPCVQVIALAPHGAEAGTAASLLGAVNFGLSGAISPIVGLLGISTAIPMGGVMLATSIVAILSLWFVVRPKTVPALTD